MVQVWEDRLAVLVVLAAGVVGMVVVGVLEEIRQPVKDIQVVLEVLQR